MARKRRSRINIRKRNKTKRRINSKRNNKKKKYKRKSRMMRLSRAGMREEEGDEEDQGAWELEVQEESIRTNARLAEPGEKDPQELTKYVDYVNEVYLCKAHCDAIMDSKYKGGEGEVKCDLLNIKKAYQEQSGKTNSNVYDVKAKGRVIELCSCSVCETLNKDLGMKECVMIGNCYWCISDKCSIAPLKNFTDCEVCRVYRV
jgi:hypothetical protein